MTRPDLPDERHSPDGEIDRARNSYRDRDRRMPVEDPMFECIRPPGNQPSRTLDRSSIRLGALLSDSRVPAKIKRGRESKSGVSDSRDISIMITERSTSIL